jgi:hypothetical protein
MMDLWLRAQPWKLGVVIVMVQFIRSNTPKEFVSMRTSPAGDGWLGQSKRQ